MMKKRGYFFVLDAVLAMSVLVIGVFIISSSYVNVPRPAQVSLLSDDLLKFLSDRKIKDINNQYAGFGGELWQQGLITEEDNTLLQQIGEFYAFNRNGIAEKFIQNVSADAIPSQFRYEVWIDGTRLYPSAPSQEHIQSRGRTELLLTSKTITFGTINKTTSMMWGPYKAEVFVWEK